MMRARSGTPADSVPSLPEMGDGMALAYPPPACHDAEQKEAHMNRRGFLLPFAMSVAALLITLLALLALAVPALATEPTKPVESQVLPDCAADVAGAPTYPSQSGCCSWHDGVCGCEDGRKVCCDGTLSPSCTCREGAPLSPEPVNRLRSPDQA